MIFNLLLNKFSDKIKFFEKVGFFEGIKEMKMNKNKIGNITVSIRLSLTGYDLTSKTLSPEEAFDGPADSNHDGWVSAEEAFEYASPKTTEYKPNQHPQIYDGCPGEVLITQI